MSSRAIVHVDGDAFFVGCELASRPKLRGRPVVTGEERGIATALSYEAKALGVTRGMPVYMIRKRYPEVFVLSSHYELYRIYSSRMVSILRRYSALVEHYSIDECFADLSSSPEFLKSSYEDCARSIKRDLETELGMTFSVGLSVNKVLAKVASKCNKPSGLTFISPATREVFLKDLPVEKVWGIGRSTAVFLNKHGIKTALNLSSRSEGFIKDVLAKPHQELWRELNGEFVFPLRVEPGVRSSVSRTRTFKPPSSNEEFIFGELSKNIEQACFALRREGFCAKRARCFLKTQQFHYMSCELSFSRPVAVPQVVLKELRRSFATLFHAGSLYRASGVTFFDLYPENKGTLELFKEQNSLESVERVYESIDRVTKKFGERIIFLASSKAALKKRQRHSRCPKFFSLPVLGTVN